jgi:hypothetical protein
MDPVKQIREMEAIADVFVERANAFKEYCHQARKKLEGVSTPSSARKGSNEYIVAQALIKRKLRVNRHPDSNQ